MFAIVCGERQYSLRILYVTQHFPPETGAAQARAYNMSTHLIRFGHEVTVLTGFPNYPTGIIPAEYRGRKFMRETIDGVDVVRTFLVPDTKKNSPVRILNYSSFMVSSIMRGSFLARPDLVFATVPPLPVGLSGYLLSRRYRVPFVLEMRDLWVDFAGILGEIRQRSVLNFAKRLEAFLLRRADRIIVVTQGYKERLVDSGIPADKIGVVTNGTDPNVFRPGPKQNWVRDEFGLTGKFVVTYAGNLGLAQQVDTLILAAKEFQLDPRVHFLVIGEGVERAKLQAMANRLGLSNVTFVPQQPRNRVVDFLSASDALVVILRNNPLFHITIPSKVFDYLAMGRPILIGVDGEARRIVEQAGAGVYFDPDDPRHLAKLIRELADDPERASNYGRNGRAAAVEIYNSTKRARQLELNLRACVR